MPVSENKGYREFRRGFWAEGVPFIWISGITVLLLIGMIAGLIGIIVASGAGNFWPANVAKLTLKDGSYLLGPVTDREEEGAAARTQVKIANRDVFGLDFKWVDDSEIVKTEYPADAAVIERMEYGHLQGFILSFKEGDTVTPATSAGFFDMVAAKHRQVSEAREEMKSVQERITHERRSLTEIEIAMRKLSSGPASDLPETKVRLDEMQKQFDAKSETLAASLQGPERELERLEALAACCEVEVAISDGSTKTVPLMNAVDIYRPNGMGPFSKAAYYAGKAVSFLVDWPRESNTEGGVYPAIFGTVMMVFLMVIICTPLGVMTALYMHEYAKPGPALSAVRMAVNNLAGVPSIVFGIFGLGFFVYFVGGGLDALFFADKLPEPTFGTGGILWASLTLALLTVPVVVVSTLEGLAAVPRANREGSLALGASKFQTIWNVVLPNAMPGILTGVILAISRAAGEVAPLMITGVVKLVSELPVDASWPFFHLDRKFMHLGFHIYDVGFQSPNVEAAKPMVYTTTGLLLLIVVALNLVAIVLRNKLRNKYRGSAL